MVCAGIRASDEFELRGRVLEEGGETITGVYPVIFLAGVTTPFVTSTLAGPGGDFKFKKLKAGSYRLTISIPYRGSMERTISIGPSLADSKGRLEETYYFKPVQLAAESSTVTASELRIPEEAQKEYRRALKAFEKRDREKAIDHLEKAVETAPHYALAWNHLGTIAYLSRDYVKAETYFKKALEHNSSLFSATVNLGAAYLSQGKLDAALEFNSRSVSARPDDALAHSQLGSTYYALGRYDEAVEELEKAKSLDPRHFSHPQLVLAEIFRSQGDYVAAAAELQEFLEYHPDSSIAPGIRDMLEHLSGVISEP
jgi:type IV pilus assembly protein PilF